VELRGPIHKRTANNVIEEVKTYASKVGMTDVLSDDLLVRGVRKAKQLTKASLVKFLITEIAIADCERNPIVLSLTQKFQLEGWLGSTHTIHGNQVPNRYGLASAVLLVHRLLDMLRVQTSRTELSPKGYTEDADVIWGFVKKHRTRRAAIRDLVQTEMPNRHDLPNCPDFPIPDPPDWLDD
jgi:hypothetical protein